VDKNEKSIGALWVKTSRNNEDFMSGEVEINGQKHPIVVFANRFYQQDTEAGKNPPAWRVFAGKPREGR
jgi:uncharacterized protein (DUF736 family)